MSNGYLVGKNMHTIMHDGQISQMIGCLTMISKDLCNESAARPLIIAYKVLLTQRTVVLRNCGPSSKAGGLTKPVLVLLNTEEKPTLTLYPKLMHLQTTLHQSTLKMIHLTCPLLKGNQFLKSIQFRSIQKVSSNFYII